MTATCLPGMAPPVTRDYFDRIPRAARALLNVRSLLLSYVLGHRDVEGYCRATNAEIGKAIGAHPAYVGLLVGELARVGPPGSDRPYFHIEGGTRRRRILPLYQPKDARDKDAPDQQPAIRKRALSNTDQQPAIRKRALSNSVPEVPGNQGLEPAAPLFEGIEEKTNVNVGSSHPDPEGVACAREGGPGSPADRPAVAAPPPIPAPPGELPAVEARPPATAPPAPAAAPPPDGIDREVAELMQLPAEELRSRLADAEVRTRHPNPAIRIPARGDRARIRLALDALEGRGEPAPTPKVGSLGPPPAVAPAATPAAPRPPSMQAVIGRLARVAGPAPVEEFVRRMAEDLGDDHSDGYFRGLAGRIRRREVDPNRVWEGYRKYRNATVRSRGAAFVAYVERRE